MEPEEAEETKAKIEVPRSFMIRKADLEKHGYTSKCPGCQAVIRGVTRRFHSTECRERLKKEMDNEDKVKEAKRKEIELHVKVHEDMQEKLKQREEKREKGAGHDHLAKNDRTRGSASGSSGDAGVSLQHRRERGEEAGGEVKRRKTNSRASEEDEESDLDLCWVEFAMDVDGVEMLKDVNVEKFVEDRTEIDIMEAFDDVTGLGLDVGKLRKARNEEITYIEAKGIWERVPLQKCWDKTGKAPTSGKWVDVQKGDDVRSRYVGRDFKPKGEGPRAEIFASMPPLEAKKIIFSRAASQKGETRIKKLLFIDVKKAHMNAVCKEWSFVDLPEEIYEAGWCAQLKYWLYGMRPAARAVGGRIWQ